MKQERIILSFIMVLIGLLVAGIAFYFYQSTKTITPTSPTVAVSSPTPTPTPKPSLYLTVSQPSDESVVSNSTLQIMGQTNPQATVVIISASNQEVIQPSSEGNFTTTLVLDNGENLIRIQSILPDGQTAVLNRTVTYSTLSF